MKILECDQTDCPANSRYVPPEQPTAAPAYSAGQGMYHNAFTAIGGGGGAGMLTINGVPSFVTGPYYSTTNVVAVPDENIHFCFGEMRVNPACMICSNLPKVDMREVMIAEKAKTMLER